MTASETEYLTPLSPIHYQLMLALLGGSSYGYALMQQAEIDSKGRVDLATSTVYLALRSMSRYGFVEAAGNETGAGSANARALYALTNLGRLAVEQETGRLAAAVDLARQRLGRAI